MPGANHRREGEVEDRSPTCPSCNKTFASYAGRRLHERRVHAAMYHQQAADRATGTRARWVDEEIELLARAEAAMAAGPPVPKLGMNQRLLGIVPGRTLDAVKGLRRKDSYKARLSELRRMGSRESGQQSPSTAGSGTPMGTRAEGVNPAAESPEAEPVGRMSPDLFSEDSLLDSPPSTRERPARESGQGPSSPSRVWRDPGSRSDPAAVLSSPRVPPRESPPASQTDPWISFLEKLGRGPRRYAAKWREDLLDEAISSLSGGDTQAALRALDDCSAHLVASVKKTPPRTRHVRRQGPRSPTFQEPSSKRRARREQFKKCQRLYEKNQSAAAAHVLSGNWRIPPTSVGPESLFSFWGGLFSRPSGHDLRPINDKAIEIGRLADSITMDEIRSALQDTRAAAPGPDGMTTRLLKSIPVRILCKLYNLWLALGVLPEPLKANRTVLIPKVPNPSEPKDYRPITISCAVVRLLHKILSSRISRGVGIDRRQKAFVPVDGCLENLAILDAIIGRARSHTHDVHLAFLDMAKAFDSVHHSTIERAMLRKGVPAPLRKYVMSSYDGAFTNIESSGDRSDDIPMSRGVKQGDPLSPTLFNLVIDEAITKVRESGLGVTFGDQKVPVLAFADDLVLVGKSVAGLQKIIDLVTETLAGGGLHVNPGKCRTISLEVDGRRKKWYVNNRRTLQVDGAAIGSLGPEDEYKYLGVQFGAGGRKKSYGRLLEEGLKNITHAPLKPQQRLCMLIQNLIPRLMHRLVLGDVFKTQLGRMDRQVRQSVRRWMRLPNDTPISFFHASTGDGGLGIPDLTSSVRLYKQSRFENLLTSDDDVVRAAAREPCIVKQMQRWSGPARIAAARVGNKTERQHGWKSNLLATCDGAGLAAHCEIPQTSRWVSSGSRFIMGWEFVQAVQVRAAALPTPARVARGRPDRTGHCEVCSCPGTLGHIAQVCPRTYGARIKRHDCVNDYVAGRLRQRGYEVVIEPHIPIVGSFRKPDIVASKGEMTWILDTQIISDQFPLSLAHNHKCEKYSTPEVLAGVRELTGRDSVEVSSITLNWRGAWHRESVSTLKGLGLSYGDLQICAIRALTGTHSLYRMWTKSTGHGTRAANI